MNTDFWEERRSASPTVSACSSAATRNWGRQKCKKSNDPLTPALIVDVIASRLRQLRWHQPWALRVTLTFHHYYCRCLFSLYSTKKKPGNKRMIIIKKIRPVALGLGFGWADALIIRRGCVAMLLSTEGISLFWIIYSLLCRFVKSPVRKSYTKPWPSKTGRWRGFDLNGLTSVKTSLERVTVFVPTVMVSSLSVGTMVPFSKLVHASHLNSPAILIVFKLSLLVLCHRACLGEASLSVFDSSEVKTQGSAMHNPMSFSGVFLLTNDSPENRAIQICSSGRKSRGRESGKSFNSTVFSDLLVFEACGKWVIQMVWLPS